MKKLTLKDLDNVYCVHFTRTYKNTPIHEYHVIPKHKIYFYGSKFGHHDSVNFSKWQSKYKTHKEWLIWFININNNNNKNNSISPRWKIEFLTEIDMMKKLFMETL